MNSVSEKEVILPAVPDCVGVQHPIQRYYVSIKQYMRSFSTVIRYVSYLNQTTNLSPKAIIPCSNQ